VADGGLRSVAAGGDDLRRRRAGCGPAAYGAELDLDCSVSSVGGVGDVRKKETKRYMTNGWQGG
jgi:hypothetical protein